MLTIASARATSAAPGCVSPLILTGPSTSPESNIDRLFRPAEIASHGAFQDGGLRFNNPINLVISEARYIWQHSNMPDVVLSLGTGTTEAQSPKAPKFRHVLNDGFIPRLCRSFMTSMDGQGTWRELENRIDEKSRRHYFRLNVGLDEAPPIDDVTCMERLRDSVHFEPNAASTRIELVSAILTASFFFELDAKPCFENGLFRCEGSIYCRNNSYGVIQTLAKTNGSRLEFSNENGYLADFDGLKAVCMRCHKYRKRIAFYVRDLNALTTVFLKSAEWPLRRISGFPQSVQWFIERQRLDAEFGSSDKISRLHCEACEQDQQKRKGSVLLSAKQTKRRRKARS